MTTYNTLKKIIPPDQALANEALSRSLRQVKQIFNSDLPTLSRAVSQLESNKDLDLISNLETPLPESVLTIYGNILGTGTGPGNTITTNDLLGVASGNTTVTALPVATDVLVELGNLGGLDTLTGNGGSATSSTNGVYTVMQYCLAGAYTTSSEVSPGEYEYTITIPSPLPGFGSYGPDSTLGNVVDAAFVNLISNASTRISTIANTYANLTQQANESYIQIATQIGVNTINCQAAEIDIGNLVMDPANANLVANSTSSILNFTTQLQDLGLDVTTGGAAQFIEQLADRSTLTGQAVVASMREGRNIAVLNAAGIQLDTQLIDLNPNETVANNLLDGQYTVAEARGNIIL